MSVISKEKSIAYIALFAALIAVLGLIPKITLPFGVPITAQSLGIMLCGCILGARRGALAVILFLALVAAGLPLLAGGRGGLAVFTGPTAGFLYGFVVAAYVTGWIVQTWQGQSLNIIAFVASVIGGILVLYPIGILGLSIVLDKSYMEAAGLVSVFIAGDLIKAVIAAALTAALMKARPNSVLSRQIA